MNMNSEDDIIRYITGEDTSSMKTYIHSGSFLYINDIRSNGFYFKYMNKEKRDFYLKQKFNFENKWHQNICFSFFSKQKRVGKYFPVLNRIVAYLHSKDAFFVEGISRYNGLFSKSQMVRESIKNQDPIDCRQYTPYELINGIKMFVFKDVNGVFNDEAFYIVKNMSVSSIDGMSILFLNCLISIMEVDCGYLFIYFLRCLGFICKMQHKTQMNSRALAIIHMPIFLGEKRIRDTSVDEMQIYNILFEKMIENFQ